MKIITGLEQSHNEQYKLINYYKELSEAHTKFSLDVMNKSMLAVDLIKKYEQDEFSSSSNNQQTETT